MREYILKVPLVICFILLILFTVGCSSDSAADNAQNDSNEEGSGEESGQGEAITMTAGSINNPTSVASIVANEMVDSIAEATDGNVQIEYYDSEQLGNGEAQLENLRTGLQDMAVSDPGWLSALDKDINVLGMPYAFRDIDHMEAFLNSPLFDEIKNGIIEEWGIRILATNWYRAPRVLQTTELVETPEDVEGLAWRVPDIPIFVEHANQMGATPTPIAYGEVYMAFQQNLVKGHDPTLEEVYPMKFHEVAPYMLETESTYGNIFILISEESYQKLSSEQQDILIEETENAGDLHVELIEEQLNEHREIMMEEGATFTAGDRDAFREKVIPMVEKMEEDGLWSEGLFEKIQEIE
ncbi:TRAP transporter substrate-binding protein [Virgibacillus oceani]